MNNIVIRNIEPQNIKISGAGEVIGITAVYVNGVNVTEGTVAYVIVPTKTSELINNSGYITNETDPTVPYYVKNISISDISKWNNKQDELVSGVNIKTINSNSLLGSGNIDINTSYSAGTGIEITDENVINNTITSYDDLDNLPTIPTKISDLTNDSDFVESSELAEVAFNGSYLALSNTPDSTSDFTNDGEDGINPFITNQTDGLINYFDKDLLFNMLPKSTGSGSSINLTDTVKNAPLYLTLGATALSQDGTPTPSSPQTIHTISGSNKVVVFGKNFFNPSYAQYHCSVSDNDITITDSGTDFYLAGAYSTTSTILFSLPAGTLCALCNNSVAYLTLYGTLGTGTSMVSLGSNSASFNDIFHVRGIRIRSTDGTTNLQDKVINLYVGTGNSYEPYVSQEADIDLDTLEYCKIGTYEDKFIRSNDGTWQLEKNIGKVVLDGTESWTKYSNTKIYFASDINMSLPVNARVYCFSNYYQSSLSTNLITTFVSETNDLNYAIGTHTTSTVIRIKNTDITGGTSAEEEANFKSWLSTHNTIVYYVLETPTYTQITGTLAEQLEYVYKDLTSETEQTNISQVNADLPFTISATTLKSLANL